MEEVETKSFVLHGPLSNPMAGDQRWGDSLRGRHGGKRGRRASSAPGRASPRTRRLCCGGSGQPGAALPCLRGATCRCVTWAWSQRSSDSVAGVVSRGVRLGVGTGREVARDWGGAGNGSSLMGRLSLKMGLAGVRIGAGVVGVWAPRVPAHHGSWLCTGENADGAQSSP